MGTVYKAKNCVNGKCYVGKTVHSLSYRKRQHESAARNGSKKPLHSAIRKYGTEAFTWSRLFLSDDEDKLFAMEKVFIKRIGTIAPEGYNLTEGGEGLSNPCEATRAKMRKAQKNQVRSEETISKIKAYWDDPKVRKEHGKHAKGREVSASTRAKIGAVHKGNKYRLGMSGWKHSQETRQKISKSLKGKKRPAWHFVNRKGHSEETKLKQSRKKVVLTESQVLEVLHWKKSSGGETLTGLRNRLGVSQTCVDNIRNGKTLAWRNLNSQKVQLTRPPITEEEVQAILDWKVGGEKFADFVKRLNVSVGYADRIRTGHAQKWRHLYDAKKNVT